MARSAARTRARRPADFHGWALQALALLTALAALTAAAAPSLAQVPPSQVCGPRADVIKELAGTYREQTVAVGIADNGAAVFEILTSAEGATWTLLYSLPSGVSCLVATGQDWQSAPAFPGPEA